jgi:hypothetical protein
MPLSLKQQNKLNRWQLVNLSLSPLIIFELKAVGVYGFQELFWREKAQVPSKQDWFETVFKEAVQDCSTIIKY